MPNAGAEQLDVELRFKLVGALPSYYWIGLERQVSGAAACLPSRPVLLASTDVLIAAMTGLPFNATMLLHQRHGHRPPLYFSLQGNLYYWQDGSTLNSGAPSNSNPYAHFAYFYQDWLTTWPQNNRTLAHVSWAYDIYTGNNTYLQAQQPGYYKSTASSNK